MKRIIQLARVTAFLMALVSVALAQETRIYREGSNWVEELKGDLGAAKTLRVKVDAGSVHVQGGSQPGISYVIHRLAYTSSESQARREFETYKISTYVKGDTAWIVADWQGGRNRKCGGDFTIIVPRNLELAKLETGGGNINVSGVAGRAEVESGGGTIHMDDVAGAISAETGGGTIDIGSVGSDVRAQTGGGTIKISSAKGKINAQSGGGNLVLLSGLQGAILETGGGNIRVEKCIGTIHATTGGGTVDLGDMGGSASIETGGGNIRLSSARGPVKAETGGGSIELNGVPSARAETGGGGIIAKFIASSADRSDSWLETGSGDITVYLANSLPISIRAAIELANGHTIHTDFSEIHVNTEGGGYGPKTVTAEGDLNGGGPTLKARTNSGSITFRRISQ